MTTRELLSIALNESSDNACTRVGNEEMHGSVKPQKKLTGRYHHGNLRSAMIALAMVEGERRGFERVSLASIAKELAVSQPASYRHFRGFDELLDSVAAEGFHALLVALRHSVAARVKQVTLLRRLAQAYVDFGVSRPQLYHLMFASPLLARADDDAEVSTIADEAFNLLVSSVAMDPGVRDPQRRAASIWAGLHGLVMLENHGLLRDKTGAIGMNMVLFLASDASSWMSGQTIGVNGGYSTSQ